MEESNERCSGSCQNTKLNMMQKEITCLRKMMEQTPKTRHDEDIRQRNHDYETEITSMFHQSTHGNQKMLEMQQMLLQTQNKIDSISTEMKAKDSLIETQNKSISSLQSQIATINVNAASASASASASQLQPGGVTPGQVGVTPIYPQTSHSPSHPITPGGGITPIYSTHTPQHPSLDHTHSLSHLPHVREHHHHQHQHRLSPGHSPMEISSASLFDSGQSQPVSYTAATDPLILSSHSLHVHIHSTVMVRTGYHYNIGRDIINHQWFIVNHIYHGHGHGHGNHQRMLRRKKRLTHGGPGPDIDEYPFTVREHNANAISLYDDHVYNPVVRGGVGSKSLNYIQMHDHESEKIYRSDSGGSMEKNRNDDILDDDNPYHVPSLYNQKVGYMHAQCQFHIN